MEKFDVNIKYKDTVFTKYFSDKNRLIEIYNAINGTAYTSDAYLEINTLDNVLYLGRYNDISFILENKLVVLIEHQSTVNLNMPLRFLLYLARLYEKMIDDVNMFTNDLVKEESVIEAVKYCINNNIMQKFLKENSGEVINMLTAEFDIEKYGEAMKKSGERIGEKKGEKKVALEAIKIGMLTKDIAKITGWSIEEIEELKEKNK